MRVLVAEDDAISRRVLEVSLPKWGHEVVVAQDGNQAWERLQGQDPPSLALLDWMMPGLEGIEVCRRVRADERLRTTYLILLTARGHGEDIVRGLDAGADDYIVKPFRPEELRARLQTGVRIVELQDGLARRVRDLESALAQVRQLHGLLPICVYCKRIRDDSNYWLEVERYVAARSHATFSHGICPECMAGRVRDEIEEFKRSLGKPPRGGSDPAPGS